MSTESMKQALDALEWVVTDTDIANCSRVYAAITALRQAIEKPEQNDWREAVLEQLVAHSMGAPTTESPTAVLARLINMAVIMATDPAIGGTQPAQDTNTCGSGAGCLHKEATIDALREQVAALTLAAKPVLSSMKDIQASCDAFHHKAKDRHSMFETCPCVTRFNVAMCSLDAAMAQKGTT